jgi:nucleotide-binding universal stress UspA family protein
MNADTLLVGTDFSEESIRAAKHAVHFVAGLDYKIELVHIIDPKHPDAGGETKPPGDQIEELARQIRGECDVEVETEVHEGPPGRTLARLSRDGKYAMVAVGYSGHGGLLSRIGSVASHTVRLVDKPILVMVPNHHTEGPIIGCIDFSEQTEKVNYWTHSIAKIRGTEPVFVHVAVPFEVLIAGTPHTGGMGIAETVLSRYGGSEEG